MSGFHSPLEQKCLEILLRGQQPIFLVLALGISPLRLPASDRKALDNGRLTLLSPYRGYPSGAILLWETDEAVPLQAMAVSQVTLPQNRTTIPNRIRDRKDSPMALSPEQKTALMDRAATDDRLPPATRAKASRAAKNLRAIEAHLRKKATGASPNEPGAE